MLVRISTLQPWRGEPIDDIQHPAIIEQLWSPFELAAVDLAVPGAFVVPPGKVTVGEPYYVMSETGFVMTKYDVADAPPPPVPEELSRWQFFAAAAIAGIITQQEAEDAITGPLPAPFAAFIATLPEGERFTATMLLRGNQAFHRHHAFVQAFLEANGMTDEQADAIWRAGATLGT
ncbi:hypothetical protein BA190_09345 [Labrys sp. WJW]|uniref:hypothetical protein n=1 Tax=Labrys sp. WJW TaxID=1737983 RepID=UPI00082FB6FB|nr:hypothetical protein [Labrys sp. WJW]OCC05110.1 hypothetical protein BA190_09345 [Labrys sp. WJW]